MNKMAIFVDVQNVYYTCRQAYKRNFDYNTFWQQATAGKQVEYAYAYAIGRSDEKQMQFQNILRGIGFEVKLKPFIQRRDGTSKGDWDVGIAVDVMELASQVDTVVLVSGDGDFAVLLDRIKLRHQVETQVYGVENLTSNTLIASADQFTAIEDSLLL